DHGHSIPKPANVAEGFDEDVSFANGIVHRVDPEKEASILGVPALVSMNEASRMNKVFTGLDSSFILHSFILPEMPYCLPACRSLYSQQNRGSTYSHKGGSAMKVAFSTVLGLAVVLALVVKVQARDDKEVTLQGSITCAKCDLKE